MNRSSIPAFIIVALVSGAIGWFLHTPPASVEAPKSSANAAAGPEPAKVASGAQVVAPAAAPAPVAQTPASVPVQTAVASSPTMPTAPVAASAPAPAAPSPAPPELVNVITELTTLVQTGDLLSVFENYMPPSRMAGFTPEQKAFFENQIRQQLSGPNGQKMIENQLAILQALNGLTPTMNAAGDRASFQVPTPKSLAPEGTNLPPTLPINFVKVDGRWYIDQ